MSDWIASTPLDQFTWQDIARLVDEQISEGPTIEFKRELSGKDGNPERWMTGAEKISEYARDEIFAELSAFANSYGGTLFLGIDERRDGGLPAATSITPIPRATRLALKFEDMVRSMFDPPLAGIEIRAIDQPEADDAGVIVFRVPQSTIAPHGFGKPAAAYVRRSASAVPMTMRDLQSVFWESRTRGERVLSRRTKFQEEFERFVDEKSSGDKGVCIRLSAIPQSSNSLPDLRRLLDRAHILRPSAHTFGLSGLSCFGHHSFQGGVWPRSHGIRGQGRNREYIWDVFDDGSINVIGYHSAQNRLNDVAVVFPIQLLACAVHVLFQAEVLRRISTGIAVPLEFDASVVAFPGTRGSYPELYFDQPLAHERSEIGPFVVEQRADLPAVCAAIEREFCGALSLEVVKAEAVKFDQALAECEPSIVEALSRRA